MIVVRMPVTDTEYEALPSWCAPRGLTTAELLAKTNTRSRRTTTHRLARNNRLDSAWVNRKLFQLIQDERNIDYGFQLVLWRSFLNWCNSGNLRHPPHQPNNDKGIASCMTHRQANCIACTRYQENLWYEKLPTEKCFSWGSNLMHGCQDTTVLPPIYGIEAEAWSRGRSISVLLLLLIIFNGLTPGSALAERQQYSWQLEQMQCWCECSSNYPPWKFSRCDVWSQFHCCHHHYCFKIVSCDHPANILVKISCWRKLLNSMNPQMVIKAEKPIWAVIRREHTGEEHIKYHWNTNITCLIEKFEEDGKGSKLIAICNTKFQYLICCVLMAR
jgi:hypothetical protein